ncbi:KH domain-containing-like protein, partial [Schistosoma japonicum]
MYSERLASPCLAIAKYYLSILLDLDRENYNYAPNIKLNDLNSRSCAHSFQPSNGNIGSNHGSIALGAQQVHFAVAATPNGLVQPHSGLQNSSTPIRSEQTAILHPTSQHPSGSLGQPFLIPGIVGQPTIRTLTQDNLSPAYRESSSTQPILTSGSKQLNNLNNTNTVRDMHPRILDVNVSINQSTYVPPVPVQQHPVVSHHQLYTSPTLQPPSLHGMVEYVQAVYPTNPNVHVPYTQQSAALFGHYPAQMTTGFDSTINTNFNSRIRHNTWAGLEDNISSSVNHDSSTRRMKNEKVLVPNDFPSTTDSQKADVSKLPGSVTFHHSEAQKHPCSFHNPASLHFNSSSITNKVDFPSNDVPYMTSVPVAQLPSRSNYQVHNNSYLSSVPSYNLKSMQQSGYPIKDNYPRTNHKPNLASEKQVSLNDRMVNSSSTNNRSSHTERHASSFSVQTTSSFVSSSGQGLISSLSTATNQDFNTNHQMNAKPNHSDHHPQFYTNAYNSINQTSDHCTGGPPKHLQNYQSSFTNNDVLSSYMQSLPENLVASLKLSGFRLVLDSCPARMLLSTSLVGSVIGRGGRTIRQITTKTGAKICMKQDIITFSQFSLPGKGKKTFRSDLNNTSHATCTNDFGDQDDEEKDETTQPSYNRNSFMNVGEDNPKVDEQPLETCSVVNTIESISGNKSQSKLEVQSDKSQLAILFGSREQCSAALCEILTICFRESKHRGFSDPCLGLLVEQHIYAQLIMNKGKKYFNAIHAATGARISVTGTPLQIRSSNDNEEHNLAPTDRVLVVRGQLKSICAAEAFLSEHIRWATIESLIPSNFWPLLNHLPSLPVNSINNRSSKPSNLSFSYDPQSVCSLIMSLGSIFWPQSVCAKLRKGTTLQYNNKQSLMRNVNMSRTDTIASKQVSTNIENNLDSVNSVDINHNHTDKHDQDVEDISNNSETINDVGNGERIMNSEESSDNNFNNRLSLNNELLLLADDDNEETLEEEVHHSKTADSVVSSDLEDKNESAVNVGTSNEDK